MVGTLSNSPWEQEQRLEREARSEGIAHYRHDAQAAVERGEGGSLGAVQRLMVFWFKPLRGLISAEKKAYSEGRPGLNRRAAGPVIAQFSTAKLALSTMHAAMSILLQEPRGVTTVRIALAIARSLNAQVNYKSLRALHLEGSRHSEVRYGHPAWAALMKTSTRKITIANTNKIAAKFLDDARWDIVTQSRVGVTLFHLLTRVATVQDYDKPFEPAFLMTKRWDRNHAKYFWRLSDPAITRINEAHDHRELLRPEYLPMTVPPLKWTDTDPGGYLELPTSFVKGVYSRRQGDMCNREMREAVNAIGATPWRVNQFIFDVVKQLADVGGGHAGVPLLGQWLDFPVKPNDYHSNPEAKKEWKSRAAWVYKQNIARRAEASIFNITTGVAERVKEFERFYFPHQLDFRGRLYPIPTLFHQQGPDLCRGLLEFPVFRGATGERAKFWIKVHLAHCCGVKTAFQDRVRWVEEGLRAGTFAGWVDKPLKNTGWMLVDDPLQALAAARAVLDDEAAAYLPVGGDGTNNALQHYAAMLRDPEAGRMVNVVPGERPEDFYGEVSRVVESTVAKHAERGNEWARTLDGWINRKLVKATAMTNYYGVTAVGARRQIYESLKKAGFPSNQLYHVSQYLSKVVLKATETTCPTVQEAMLWLRSCAKAYITQTGQCVRWRSPIGMEIEQPYRSGKSFEIKTPFHDLKVRGINETDPPRLCRHVNGFPPNFVHSIDASHVMACAILAAEQGICFSAVHDRVITHAADMDWLMKTVREQFAIIHEEPLLERLHKELKERGVDIAPPPPTGKLDVSRVVDSTYLFS